MSSTTTWTKFLGRSLATRLDPEKFESYVVLLSSKHPLSATRISDLFLSPSSSNNSSLDPRIPQYLQVLLTHDLVNVPAILTSLLKFSTFASTANSAHTGVNDGQGGGQAGGEDNHNKEDAGEKDKLPKWISSYAAEEALFYRLGKHISSHRSPRDLNDAVKLLLVCISWMQTMPVAAAATQERSILDLHSSQNAEVAAAVMAFGTFLIAVTENEKILAALSRGRGPKGVGKEFSKALAVFVPLLIQSSTQNAQSAARLEMFRAQTLVTLLPVDKKEDAVAAAEIDEIIIDSTMGLDSVPVVDLPPMNSRAGLYVWLNSLLVSRPLIDDNYIFSYLHNRYQGDIQSTAIDLVTVSFDMLANATFRSKGAQTTTLMRSFLVNKLPLLLMPLSASLFPPFNIEYCITEALQHIDTNAFPTLSSMFDESSNNSIFSESVRQDFCFACCLHGLILESSIETLLGDVPMQSLPASGRYAKDDLVQQCLSDSERLSGFIDELENMDGNVGAICQAIAEVMSRLCSTKETMTLKALCSQLARKSTSLDVMLLFNKPATILQPICELLDHWQYDEDQGEYTPVYEEFGSILLLVSAFVYRYDLSTADLGIRSSESFVAKLLNQGHLSRAMETLSDTEQKHLDGWIRGLFDGEGGGLGDELMSSCPPQDFYLLVPTLFHHIVLACSTGNLNEEALKNGLEYLVEPFLLPSLVGAINWLSSHLWESRGDANAVLQILSTLILNHNSVSNEASNMLNTILNIVSKNLEHSLRWLQRAEPSRQDVDPLSKAIKGNLGWERRGGSEHTELEGWTATHGGGLFVSLKNTITALVQWGLNPGLNIIPASYTHRQVLIGVKMLGARRFLSAIIEEIKSQTEEGHGSVVIDVATALVCAPDARSFDGSLKELGLGDIMDHEDAIQPLQRRMTIREALKMEVDNAPKIHKTDPTHAEALIRLYRRVEAQMVHPQTTMLAHDAIGGLDATIQGALDGALDAAQTGLMGDVSGHQGMSNVMGGGDHTDIMSGLMGGGGDGDDLLDPFGVNGDLGDDMGF